MSDFPTLWKPKDDEHLESFYKQVQGQISSLFGAKIALLKRLAKSNFALCFKALEWPNCNWHFLLYPRNFSISKRWNNCQLFYKNAWCEFGFFGCVIIILKNSCFWAFINNNLPSIVCIEIDSARGFKTKKWDINN